MSLEIVPVLSIVVVCYLIGLFCKAMEAFPDKFIPVTVGIVGGVLGMAAFYTIPGFAAENWLTALEIGIASGLASTGVNQVYKQIKKDE